MHEVKLLKLFCRVSHTIYWAENWTTVFTTHIPLHVIFPRKTLSTHRTGPSHVNSVEAFWNLAKKWNVSHLYRLLNSTVYILPPPPPPPLRPPPSPQFFPPPSQLFSLLLLENFISLLVLLLHKFISLILLLLPLLLLLLIPLLLPSSAATILFYAISKVI